MRSWLPEVLHLHFHPTLHRTLQQQTTTTLQSTLQHQATTLHGTEQKHHSMQSYHSLSPSFHYSPLPNLSNSPLLCDEAPDVVTPRMYPVQRQVLPTNSFEAVIEDLESRLVSYIDRKFDELFSFLHTHRQTPLLNFRSTTPHTMSQHRQHFETQQHHIPQAHTHTSTDTEDSGDVNSSDDLGPTSEKLLQLKTRACSKQNFAVLLVREIFQGTELVGRNVEGKQGKQPLDPIRIQKIKKIVMDFYPAPPMQQDQDWTNCRKTIDSSLRRNTKKTSE